MLKPITIAAIGLCAVTAAAFAQSSSGPKAAAECQQMWQRADANSDGMLAMNEIVGAMAMNNTASTGTTGSSGSTTGTTGSTTPGSADTTTGSTTGTTGSSDMATGSTSSTTGSTTGTTGSTAAGSAAGMMVSQQDFMTACTTGQ